MRTACFWMVLALTLAGCSIVSRDRLDQTGGADAAVDSGETGPTPDDQCGESTPGYLLTNTTPMIEIDTTSFGSDNSSACGVETPGPDAFIAVDVQAGEYWHFHLAGMTPGLLPMLYLTQSCDSRSCDFVSSACVGGQDEHFAFVADAPGRWFIGIDDSSTMGGGDYRLAAFRPECRNGTREHGEGCDDGNATDGDGCDRRCREELSDAATGEVEPNDNRVEANALRLPAANVLEITGDIGGPGTCTYADVFAVSVPASGDLHVTARNMDGTACTSSALTPFRFALERSTGETIASGMQDAATMCAIINAVDLAEGEYFIRIEIPNEIDPAAFYRMRVELAP